MATIPTCSRSPNMNRRRLGLIASVSILLASVGPRPALAQEAGAGFEEFRIELNSSDKPAPDGGRQPPEWLVKVRSCPIPEFNDWSTPVRPSFTVKQLN